MHIRRRTWFLQNKFTKLHNTILQRIVGIRKKNTCVHNYCAVFCLSDDNTRSKKNQYSNSLKLAFLLWSFESKSTQILRNIIHRCIFCFLSQLNHVQTSLIELELICHLCSTLKTCSKITYNIPISLYIL